MWYEADAFTSKSPWKLNLNGDIIFIFDDNTKYRFSAHRTDANHVCDPLTMYIIVYVYYVYTELREFVHLLEVYL